MDVNAITQLVSGLGFPIVACFIMWKALQDSTSAHKVEMAAMQESLNKNTMVLVELKTMIETITKGIERDINNG